MGYWNAQNNLGFGKKGQFDAMSQQMGITPGNAQMPGNAAWPQMPQGGNLGIGGYTPPTAPKTNAPTYTQPSYTPPNYPQPQYQTPQYQAPASNVSTYQPPQYQAPQYSGPDIPTSAPPANNAPPPTFQTGGPNSGSNQPYTPNPYIEQQAANLKKSSNQNLKDVLNQTGQAANMAGQYGSSRHGVAEGVAAAQRQTGLDSAISNLYASGYGTDTQAGLQGRGLDLTQRAQDQGFYLGNRAADSTTRGQDLSYNVGMTGAANQKYGTDVGAALSKYGTDVGAGVTSQGQQITQALGNQANALGYAGLQNQANLANQANALGYAGLQNQYGIAGMGNQLGYAGLQNQADIANLANQLGYANLGNQYQIANLGNLTTQRGQDITQQLGNQANALGYAGLGNQFDIASMGNQTNQRGQDYNLAGQWMNNLTQQQGQDQNFYTQQRAQDLNQLLAGNTLYNSGNAGNLGIGQGQYNIGQQQLNAPLWALQQYGNGISPYTGLNSSQIATGQTGGGAMGAAGGALAGAQIANNLGIGSGSSGWYPPGVYSQNPNNWSVPQYPPAAPAYWPAP